MQPFMQHEPTVDQSCDHDMSFDHMPGSMTRVTVLLPVCPPQNARDVDPNAMLRLAKMYLHGQGCRQNIALAQEWVRKAR